MFAYVFLVLQPQCCKSGLQAMRSCELCLYQKYRIMISLQLPCTLYNYYLVYIFDLQNFISYQWCNYGPTLFAILASTLSCYSQIKPILYPDPVFVLYPDICRIRHLLPLSSYSLGSCRFTWLQQTLTIVIQYLYSGICFSKAFSPTPGPL